MKNRISKSLVAGAAIVALAIPAAAQAQNGADDPVGQHQEHSVVVAAPTTTATKTTVKAKAHKTRHRHHGRHGRRHAEDNGVRRARGADDGPTHVRHTGNDDGPNHT